MENTRPKITFILNTTGLTGGIKVIFEHTNQFARKGYPVELIHLLRLEPGPKGLAIGLLKKIKYLFAPGRPNWFELDPKIIVRHCLSLNANKMTGLVLATANETADWVNKLHSDRIKKFYFIQDYETWSRDPRLVEQTYYYPLKKIVATGSWLKTLLEEKYGQKICGPVFNGVHFEKFNCSAERGPHSPKRIIMLYHVVPKKGTREGLEAIALAKKSYPDLELIMFGAYPNPHLPEIKEYYFQPKPEVLRQAYNSADIFLCPSFMEGFTLTPMEAMAAGCAVVATAVGGVNEYGIDNETALVVSPGRVDLMAAALLDLLHDEDKRKRLARNGQEYIKNFSWEKSNDCLEKILLEN